MKNSLTGWLLATAAVCGMGFTSCQDNEADLDITVPQGEKIEVSLTAVIDGAETRALTHDRQIMKFTWNETDKIEVVNAETGVYLGTLGVAVISDEGRSCTFSGSIIPQKGNNVKLNYFFLGENGKLQLNESKYLAVDTEFTYATQDGTHDSLDDFDILTGTKTYEGGVSSQLGTILFKRYISFGEFVLVVEDASGNQTPLDFKNATHAITVSSADDNNALNNALTLKVKAGDDKTLANNYECKAGNITVSSSSSEFYMNFVPSDLNNAGLKFTCTVDGDVFEGTVGDKNIGENVLITRGGKAVPVVMKNMSKKEVGFKYSYDGKEVKDTKEISSQENAEFTIKGLPEGWTAPAGKELASWTGSDGKTYEPNATATLKSDAGIVTLTPNWKQTEFAVIYKDGADGAVFGDESHGTNGNVLKEGDNTPKWNASTTRKGYKFTGWLIKGTNKGWQEKIRPEDADTNGHIIYVAQWEEAADPNTIGTSDYGHGTINM